MSLLHPSYLYIGNQNELLNIILSFIKKNLCANAGCDICINCSKINLKQHHLLCWLEPENQYSVSQLDIIFETIIYKRESNEHYFFVINRADLLNSNSANRLLKSLEEPPRGYHFILTAPTYESVLPTISSRCVIQNFISLSITNNSLDRHFTTDLNKINISEFVLELENKKILEREVLELIDVIHCYWLNVYKKAIQNNDINLLHKAEKFLDLLDDSREYLPMPGSAKIFLKNLMLNFIALNDQ